MSQTLFREHVTTPDILIPANEAERLAAVRRYDILDTPPDGACDRITAIAARLFNVPISIISVVDRDRIWFKSRHGVSATEIGRDPGLCASVVLRNEPRILPDAKIDPHALANPLVAGEFGLRFYAGVPLRTRDGFSLGTLCVIDKEPREVSTEEVALLEDLASVVMDQLELRLAVRKHEEIAQQRRHMLQIALAASETGTFRFDLSKNEFLEFDEILKRLFGFAPGEPVTVIEDFIARVDPNDLPRLVSAIDRCREGADLEMEFRVIHPDGSIHWLYDRAKMERDAKGKPIYLVGACTDNTRRTQSEYAARETAQRFLFMAETMPQKIFTATANGDVDYFNQQWTEFTGLPFDQIRGWGWTQFIHPDDVEQNIWRWRRSIDSGEPFEFVHRFRRADGAYRWHLSRARAMRNASGAISVWVGSNTEIHEQKEMAEALRQREEALRESEAYLHLVLDSAPDGFCGVDREGVTTMCNAAFLRMLGFERAEDAVGKKLHDVVNPADADGSRNPAEECQIYRTARTGQAAHNDSRVFHRVDGSSFPVEYWSYTILRVEKVCGAVVTFIDISERRRAQEQQNLILREMRHRVKNLFALAGSIVALCVRSAETPKGLSNAVQGRLAALARANELTLPDVSEGREKSDRATTFPALVKKMVAPYVDEVDGRVTIGGPDVPIRGNAVTGLALVLHETATNAAKYGALSIESGHVNVGWSVEMGELVLTWQERGGPRLSGPPEKGGFGTSLARLTVTGQLAGRISRDWNDEGLTVHLSVPLERLTE